MHLYCDVGMGMVHRIFACLKLFPVCSKCFRSPVAKHPSLLTTDRGVFRYRYSAHLQVAGRAEQCDHKTRIRGNGAVRPPTGSSRSADPLPPLGQCPSTLFYWARAPFPSDAEEEQLGMRGAGGGGDVRRAPVDQRTVIPSAACYAN